MGYAGTDRQQALRQAHANAKLGKKPYHVFHYGHGWWVEGGIQKPVSGSHATGHTIVYPDGTWEGYDPVVGPPAFDAATGNRKIPKGATGC